MKDLKHLRLCVHKSYIPDLEFYGYHQREMAVFFFYATYAIVFPDVPYTEFLEFHVHPLKKRKILDWCKSRNNLVLLFQEDEKNRIYESLSDTPIRFSFFQDLSGAA